jgi:hypothetical protein
MLYVVGGAPRAGKTPIDGKFTRDTGIPFFSIDYLKMGLSRGIPEYGVIPNKDDLITAGQLWPVLQGMGRTYLENNGDNLLEGL